MSTVIGLDPSMSGFAVCRLSESSHELFTHKEEPIDDLWESRLERYRRLAEKVSRSISSTEAPIFIEGYSYNSKNSRAHSTGEFGCYIRLKLSQIFRVQIVEVAPKELKSWVSGNGNAGKPLMISKLSVQTGIEFSDDNQVDAYGLAWIGRCVLGLDEPTNQTRRDIVKAVRDRHKLGIF